MPSEKVEVLLTEASRNLATWRFEPGPQKIPLRITYSYVIDSSLPIPAPYHQQIDARLELPNQITIRGRRLQ